MDQLHCPNCGSFIPEGASACPNCGHCPQSQNLVYISLYKQRKKHRPFLAILGIAALVLFTAAALSKMPVNKEELMASQAVALLEERAGGPANFTLQEMYLSAEVASEYQSVPYVYRIYVRYSDAGLQSGSPAKCLLFLFTETGVILVEDKKADPYYTYMVFAQFSIEVENQWDNSWQKLDHIQIEKIQNFVYNRGLLQRWHW